MRFIPTLHWSKMKLSIAVVSLITKFYFCTSEIISEKDYASMPPLFHLDDYDRCMLYGEEALYCMITVQLRPQSYKNVSEVWRVIEQVSSKPRHYRHDLLRHGVCIPEICPNIPSILKNQSDIRFKLNAVYNLKYENKGIESEVTTLQCETKESPYAFDIYDIGFAIFVSLYSFIIICVSIHERVVKKNKSIEKSNQTKSLVEKCISAISIQNNWKRLMYINVSNKDMQSLRCIQGVRFYTTLAVIMIHVSTGMTSSFVSNPQFVEKTISNTRISLTDPTFAMQVFFLISFWLLAFNFFVEMENKKKIPILHMFNMFIKRYIRLTPAMAFVVLFSTTWLLHISRGPVWDFAVAQEVRKCKENWWTSLLYINNFINMDKFCFNPGWYLTVSMQLYVLSLLLLWLMWNYQKLIVLVLGSVLISHIGFVFWTVYANNYSYSLRPALEYVYRSRLFNSGEVNFIYISNVANSSALVAGLAYGYLFYKFRNEQIFKTKVHVTLWWIATLGINFVTILLPSLVVIDSHISPIYNALYASLWRCIFNFSFGMFIFGITQGHGWLIKWACEASPVYILGRLTYSAYLIDTLFVRIRMGVRRSPNYVGQSVFFYEAVQDITLSFVGGLLLTLFIEMPIYELYKLLISKKCNNSNKKGIITYI